MEVHTQGPIGVENLAAAEKKLDGKKNYDLPKLNQSPESSAEDPKDISKFGYLWRVILALFFLYLFICSLDILSKAFRLLGGESAGKIFSNNKAVNDPIAGLMIGVLVTVLVQSSSTFSSIVIAMVASGFLTVRQAIPMIMGANIGTSVSNTIVSLSQLQNNKMFERSFAAATVHDVFNILTVLILLPLETLLHPLLFVSGELVSSLDLSENGATKVEILSRITDPLTDMLVVVDKDVIKQIALGQPLQPGQQILQKYCSENKTLPESEQDTCFAIFSHLYLSDVLAGLVLLVLSLFVLFTCLVMLVKMLQSIFQGHISNVIHKTVSAEFPGCLKYLTGYASLLIGIILTILVQSSSILTSTITPLVGLNIVTLETAYPLTLGSNIGTTLTGLLTALTAEGEEFQFALQIGLCHFLFNVIGIVIWYPIPLLRKVPLKCASQLGRTTSKYPWFAFVYIFVMFFIFPGAVFGLSLLSSYAVIAIVGLIGLVVACVCIITFLQRNHSTWLPEVLQSWKFLPKWMRSLEPFHRSLLKTLKKLKIRRLFAFQLPDSLPSKKRATVTGLSIKSVNFEVQESSSFKNESRSQINIIDKNVSRNNKVTASETCHIKNFPQNTFPSVSK